MADPTPTPPTPAPTGLTVPPEVQAKFGELIELVKKSESMNDEERQYWVNILPIMTPEQIQNLREILDNERKQLAAIDAKYQTDIDKLGQAEVLKQTEEARRKKRMERSGKESSAKAQEDKAAEDLLKQMEGASPSA
jgi:hypothetical protein